MAVWMLLGIACAAVLGQVTGPSAVSTSGRTFQTSAENAAGSALSWFGWNRGKEEYFRYPAQIEARVDSAWSIYFRLRVVTRYAGLTDTSYYTGPSYAAFWLPDSGRADGGIPDSLFYIVPDSAGVSAGDEFRVSSAEARPLDTYNYRLLFASDTSHGTAADYSQPVWIGHGVASLIFAYQARDDTSGLVYRTSYSNAYGGPYIAFMSSDTLADSSWTSSCLAGSWNYRAATASAIDELNWMRVERIGTAAADTLIIDGEQVYIRGN